MVYDQLKYEVKKNENTKKPCCICCARHLGDYPFPPPLHPAAQMDTPSGGSKVDPTSLSFLWAAA